MFSCTLYLSKSQLFQHQLMKANVLKGITPSKQSLILAWQYGVYASPPPRIEFSSTYFMAFLQYVQCHLIPYAQQDFNTSAFFFLDAIQHNVLVNINKKVWRQYFLEKCYLYLRQRASTFICISLFIFRAKTVPHFPSHRNFQ